MLKSHWHIFLWLSPPGTHRESAGTEIYHLTQATSHTQNPSHPASYNHIPSDTQQCTTSHSSRTCWPHAYMCTGTHFSLTTDRNLPHSHTIGPHPLQLPTQESAATAAKSLQSCPTLCDPIDGSPPGSPVPRILQARTLEWVAISFFNAWKWKVKVKSLSRIRLFTTPWTAAYQPPLSMRLSRQEYWSGVPLPSPEMLLRDSNYPTPQILKLVWSL